MDSRLLIDSNTNWLVSCSLGEDCGEGEECVCGSGVIPCEAERGCRIREENDHEIRVSCSGVDPVSESSSCGENYMRPLAPICLPECQTEAECPDLLICHEGTCRRPRRG